MFINDGWRIWLRGRRRGLLTLFAVALFSVGVASAHSVELLRSVPGVGAVVDSSPSSVEAWFNEELQTGASSIQVYDADGKQVDLGDGGVNLNDPYHASMVVSLPTLPDGAYLVRWHVVLLDNDPTDGEFHFFVGQKVDVPAALPVSAPAVVTDSPAQESDSGLPLLPIVAASSAVIVLGIIGLMVWGRRKERAGR